MRTGDTPLQAEPLPGWCYTSEEFYRREIEQVFSRNWICLGREDALPRVGDYRAFEFCGKKLILVRSAENRISLLDNVCRDNHHWGVVMTPDCVTTPVRGELPKSNDLSSNPRGPLQVTETPLADIGR